MVNTHCRGLSFPRWVAALPADHRFPRLWRFPREAHWLSEEICLWGSLVYRTTGAPHAIILGASPHLHPRLRLAGRIPLKFLGSKSSGMIVSGVRDGSQGAVVTEMSNIGGLLGGGKGRPPNFLLGGRKAVSPPSARLPGAPLNPSPLSGRNPGLRLGSRSNLDQAT